MNHRSIVAAATTASALVFAAPASGEYYFTKTGVGKIVAYDVRDRYTGFENRRVFSSCRPQGDERYDPSFKYHRWVCGWAAGALSANGEAVTCSGQIRVIGSRGTGAYYSKVIRGEQCTLDE